MARAPGYVLVESMRPGTRLEGLPLTLKKIERYRVRNATPSQPSDASRVFRSRVATRPLAPRPRSMAAPSAFPNPSSTGMNPSSRPAIAQQPRSEVLTT
jgi:hypothetical protein